MESFAHYAPTIGLLFFFLAFVSIVIWAMRPSKKQELEALANIPLKNDIMEEKHG